MDIDNIKNSNNKTKLVTGTVLGVTVLLVVLAVSYAFLPTDNLPVEPVDATASTAELKLRYTDCANEDASTCGDIAAELAPGDSMTKVFSISNVGTVDINYDIYFRELMSTFVNEELVYKLEDLTSNEVIVEETVVPNGTNDGAPLKNSLVAKVGTTVLYKLTITYLDKDYNQIANRNAEFSMKVGIREHVTSPSEKTLTALGLESNGVRTEFDEPATTDEGIFEMEDDYGTSYYYRGAVTNNYVKFAGFYWRIIRINGDGSVRIIYDGTQAHANGANNTGRVINTSTKYNINYNDNKYVGWMYGPTGTATSKSKEEAQTNTVDSTIKKVVDAWYKTNVEGAGYGDAVSDTLFCNDRSTPGIEVTGWSSDTGLGYGKNATAYGATARMRMSFGYTGITPLFKCPGKNDSFTVNDTNKGNGALTYPVGLITIDEIVAAGSGKKGTSNNKYYLYNPSANIWSLSPDSFGASYSYTFFLYTTGLFSSDPVNSDAAITPVINLSSEYASALIGDGTMENPYQEA